MPNILDPVVNFGLVTVSTGYNDTDTAIQLVGGEGAKLPDPSSLGAFNMTWWNATQYANPSQDPNVEIVRVTAKAADLVTVTRAQEGTVASTKSNGADTYMMSLGVTKKTLEDLLPFLNLPASHEVSVTYLINGEIDTISGGGVTYQLNRLPDGRPNTFTFGSQTISLNRDSLGRVIDFTLS